MRKLKILMVASEVLPYAKTGGLADVVRSLSSVLAERGHQATIVLPYYREVQKRFPEIEPVGVNVRIDMSGRMEIAKALRHSVSHNLTAYFVANDKYYDRDELYGDASGDYEDNAERFIFFDRAVVAICEAMNYRPDIVHCHDWHTGLVTLYIKENRLQKDGFWNGSALVFTIHNIGYQGVFGGDSLHLTDLDSSYFNPQGIEFFGKINLMKAGILYADRINTVSKRFAEEIQTEELGYGLDGVLRERRKALTGILNGVDYSEWSPETDRYIKRNYTKQDLSGKRECKRELIEIFRLEADLNTPLIGFVSRMTRQKGIDILIEAIPQIVKMHAGLVVLGKGEETYVEKIEEMGRTFRGKIGVKIAFDNALAHKIEAGCDIFLMPSMYEPCGLNQMYSLRYGTVPVVRATGGLDDTVREFSTRTLEGNGFRFRPYTARSMLHALKKTIGFYRDALMWRRIMKNGMKEDFSWDSSAKRYERLYAAALKGVR